MLLSTQLLMKFNDENIKLSERLCAAKGLFSTCDPSYISRKEEFVLDWLTNVLEKHDTVEVWKTIRDCLSSQQMQNIRAVEIRQSTKDALCKALIKSECRNRVLRECALLCIERRVFQQYFRTHKHSFFRLVQVLLKSIGENSDVGIFIACSQNLREYSKQNFGDEEMFRVFVENLLVPSVEAYTLLLNALESRADSINPEQATASLKEKKNNTSFEEEICELQKEFVQLVECVVFPKSLHRVFFFNFQRFNKSTLANSNLTLLCDCLSSITSTLPENIVANLYTVIFHAFVENFQSHLVYQFFALLCSFLGFCPDVQANSRTPEFKLIPSEMNPFANPRNALSLPVLQSLLQVLVEGDVLFDREVKNISFLQWLQALVVDITSNEASTTTFNIIICIGHLNPLIIEPVINKLLQIVLLKPKPTFEEKHSYKCLLHGIFSVFIKLRRIPEFIGNSFLPTLKKALEEKSVNGLSQITMSEVVPEGSLYGFTSHLMTLPNTISVSILRILNQHLADHIVEAIKENNCDGGHWLTLDVISYLLQAFFNGVRLAEQKVHPSVRSEFVSELLKLRSNLGAVGTGLLQREHNNRALGAVLRTSHAIGEMQHLLLLYSPLVEQRVNLELLESSETNSAGDLHCIHSFLTSQEWNSIAQRIVNFGDSTCRRIMDELMLQKLHALNVFGRSISRQVEMKSALCKHFIDHIDTWWHLFLDRHSSTLASLLTPEHVFVIAEAIISQLLTKKSDTFDELRKPVLQENQTLIIALTWVTVQKISRSFMKKRHRNGQVFLHDRLLRGIVRQVEPVTALLEESDRVEMVTDAFPTMVSLISSVLNVDEDSEELQSSFVLDMESLEKHLFILRTLPLVFMPKHIRSLLALVIFSTIVCLNRRVASDESKRLPQVHATCLEILLGLVELSSLPVLVSQLDPGKVIEQLCAIGPCPPTLLEYIFQSCLSDSKKIKTLASSAVEVDDSLSTDKSSVSLLLLKFMMKEKLLKRQEYNYCVRQLLRSLWTWLRRCLHISQALPLHSSPLMDAYGFLLVHYPTVAKPEKAAKLLPHLDNFMSSALTTLSESQAQESLGCALALLKAILLSRQHFEQYHSKKLMVPAFRAAFASRQKGFIMPYMAQLLCLASEKEFQDVMKFAGSSEDLKSNLLLLQHLAATHLPDGVSAMFHRAVYQTLNSLRGGETIKLYLSEVLALELAVSKNMMKARAHACDTFLLSIMVAMEDGLPEEEFGPVASMAMELLSGLVRYAFPLIEDRIPMLLCTLKLAVRAVVAHSVVGTHLSGPKLEHMINCAHYIERLSDAMAAEKKTFKNVSHFLVADVLSEMKEVAVHPDVKKHLMKSLYSFLELCDEHANSHLLHALPYASLELYKRFTREYKQFYRYKGKV